MQLLINKESKCDIKAHTLVAQDLIYKYYADHYNAEHIFVLNIKKNTWMKITLLNSKNTSIKWMTIIDKIIYITLYDDIKLCIYVFVKNKLVTKIAPHINLRFPKPLILGDYIYILGYINFTNDEYKMIILDRYTAYLIKEIKLISRYSSNNITLPDILVRTLINSIQTENSFAINYYTNYYSYKCGNFVFGHGDLIYDNFVTKETTR